MQYKLLQKELRSTETTSDIRQKIFESSPGQDPHHTTAITLVFEGLTLSAQNALIPFSVTTPAYPTTKFAPFHGGDPAHPNVTVAYQSISCMPCYHSLSFEVRSLEYYAIFGLKYLVRSFGLTVATECPPNLHQKTPLPTRVLQPLASLPALHGVQPLVHLALWL